VQQNCSIFLANLVMNLSLFIEQQCVTFNNEFIHKLNQFDLRSTFWFPYLPWKYETIYYLTIEIPFEDHQYWLLLVFLQSCITNFAFNNLVMEIMWNTKVSKFCVRMLCVENTFETHVHKMKIYHPSITKSLDAKFMM
jgi:hypothetical protein